MVGLRSLQLLKQGKNNLRLTDDDRNFSFNRVK